MRRVILPAFVVATTAGLAIGQPPHQPPGGPPQPAQPAELPPFADISKGFEKVVSTADGKSWYTIYRRDKDHQLLAELPRDFEDKRFFVVPTVAAGDLEAGVYPIYTRWGAPGERYVYWTRVRNRLMMVEPNLSDRTTGDDESKLSTKRVYTDRMVLETPILAMGPGGGPVIDLDAVLLGSSGKFFGYFTSGLNAELAKVSEVKSFPLNTEIAFTAPVRDGTLATIHYSLSSATPSPGYKTREADRRIGYFYVNFTDKAKNDGESQTTRYITRWNLEKRDPKLKMSPPKTAITYYIEHTTPVRYRRWVREGLLEWNKAFEKVGIVGAVEALQQDAATGDNMDKDPEDARYNFIRWTNSNMGYAIGPSRVIPETGEIIDADIVMDEGFISGWAKEVTDVFPEALTQSFDSETLDWLATNPEWDPRVRLAPIDKRDQVLARLKAARTPSAQPAETTSLLRQILTANSARSCAAMRGSTAEVALARLALSADMLDMALPAGAEAGDLLEGLPEWYIGPLLKYIVMHEVGHTLGLMHNFKASSIYSLEQITSPEWKGKRPIAGSVMEYMPSNILPGGREQQGDPAMIGLGKYDYWAIEWGYTAADPKDIAKRAAEPELAFMSDEGMFGPDPQTRVWDLSSDSLQWAQQQISLVEQLRSKLLDRVVKDGQSWQKARDGYMLLFSKQIGALSAAAHWIGGDSIARDRRGDPNGRDPITVVPVEKQRAALKFVIENGLREEAYGVSPALLSKFGADSWPDESYGDLPDFPINDTVLGAQATTLTFLMNPTRLRRVLDNEVRTPAGQDMITMPEILGAVRAEVWSDLGKAGTFTARQPMVSAFRRNLQREHLNRLVTLSTSNGWPGASSRPLTALARQELRDLKTAIANVPLDKADPYTRSHLADASERIARALDATYIRTN